MKTTLAAVAAHLALLAAAPALAATYEIEMLNQGEIGRFSFDPAFLRIEPGDTVVFVPVDRGHSSELIDQLAPEGGQSWRGRINQEISATLNEPGLYAYKCLPHYAVGMVGLIQVGDSTQNVEEIRAADMPGLARRRMDQLLRRVQ